MSITTNTSGQLVSGQLYKAWGEVRYSLGTSPTKYTFTGQYSNVSEFGLMFYNARWYDPVSGRFTSADIFIPSPYYPQAYDRYAYVNNSPVNFVDPSGHFTEDAIEKYLKNTYGKDWKDYWNAWSADEDWWNMLLAAQEGDVLFGITQDGYQYSVTFTGSGITSLTGIELTHVPYWMEDINLNDIQKGKYNYTNYPYYDQHTEKLDWFGIYRTDEETGEPSFYVRPGYELEQTTWKPWASKWADQAGGALIGGVIAGPWGTVFGFFTGGTLPTASDVLNMEPYDVNVQVGPVQFNFQLQPGGTWELEDGPKLTAGY